MKRNLDDGTHDWCLCGSDFGILEAQLAIS